MGGGDTKGAGSAAVLKYDQTGEALQQQPAGEEGDDSLTTGGKEEELACSVLTPEQIFSQLSMVLQTRYPAACVGDVLPSDASKGDVRVVAGGSGSCASTGAPRKLNNKAKRARERKTRKAAGEQQQQQQPKRAKTAEKRAEKRPRRRQRHIAATRRPSFPSSSPASVMVTGARESSSNATAATAPSTLTAVSQHHPGVHVVVISPEHSSPSLRAGSRCNRQRVAASNSPPPPPPPPPAIPLVYKTAPLATDSNTTAAMETPSNNTTAAMETPRNNTTAAMEMPRNNSTKAMEPPSNNLGEDKSNSPRNIQAASSAKNTVEEDNLLMCKSRTAEDGCSLSATCTSKPLDGVAMETTITNDNQRRQSPLNYDLLGRLIGEQMLTSFYRDFHAHPLSKHLDIRLLDPLGEGTDFHRDRPTMTPKALPRWLQITRKKMHIDPHLGPISLARILVSNAGIVKFQHLFPVIRTVFMHHVKGCNLTVLLSELSPRQVLCPGLPDYPAHYAVLGYHPREVRIIHTQTPDYRRFDHRECPILHTPELNLRRKGRFPDNMCIKCIQLHTVILRILGKMPMPVVPPDAKKPRSTSLSRSSPPAGDGASSSSDVESPPLPAADPHSVPGMGVWELALSSVQ